MRLHSLCREGAQERAHKPEELELESHAVPVRIERLFACLVTVGALSFVRFTQAMLLARSLALAAVCKAMMLASLRSLVPGKWGRRP